MPKSNLSIALGPGQSNFQAGGRQPLSPQSPRSPPHSGNLDESAAGYCFTPTRDDATPIGPFPAPPESPASPKHGKDSSRSFFSLPKASKSSSRIPHVDSTARKGPDNQPMPSASQIYAHGQAAGSSPSLGCPMENGTGKPSHSHADNSDQQSVKANSINSSNTAVNSTDGSKRPPVTKSRFGILTRTRSTSARSPREPSEQKEPAKLKPKPSTPRKMLEKEREEKEKEKEKEKEIEKETKREQKHKRNNTGDDTPKSASYDTRDRKFKSTAGLIGSAAMRNRSLDRAPVVDSEDDGLAPAREKREHFFSSSFKEGGSGASFLNNIRSHGSKAADGIGKAAKGLAGKIGRSGSGHEKEAVPEDWSPKVINLPLVEQTRLTRISQRLEDSKDKTEFWMPALPWRCIDYLNMKGCEEEGLYRVPGSGKEIKQWQMRFDREYDINLFDEPELYDINIIGSMFKSWLRDLPDEIFPKATQARIAEQCAGAKSTPQMLKDELSKLPPFNYYLLFAITCHISLLHSCSEMNKMDYRNLCICFQPCMKIEAFCFQFLVLDWRNCWQGCWTEKEYLAVEIRYLAQRAAAPSPGLRNMALPAAKNTTNGHKERKRNRSASSRHREQSNDRAISSSGSSKPSIASLSDSTRIGTSTPEKDRERERPRPPPIKANAKVQENQDFPEDETAITPTQAEHTLPVRLAKENAPSLSPMKPLSPMSL